MDRDKILKYLKNLASQKEIREVEAWINSSSENTEAFNLLKAEHIISSFEETEKIAHTDASYRQFKNKIRNNNSIIELNPNRKWDIVLKYAAILIVTFGVLYSFFIGSFHNTSTTAIAEIKEDVITLKLENGTLQVLEENGDTKVTDSNGNMLVSQQGNKLKYNSQVKIEKLKYNTLKIPYGKRFNIILSDGSHVVLNSGTSLRYPVKFIKGKNREVYLTGEAFFEVARNTEEPFIVNAKGLSIKVVGTKFNVSAYTEDATINTALVEGAVDLYQEYSLGLETPISLKPGHLASLNKTNKNISVQETDTSIYTAWINGDIIFKHIPFKHIVKKLERQYNVLIVNNNSALNDQLFTASFESQSLEQILKTFKDNYGINYRIQKDKIIIN
ncbi:FecR family protein [Formosa sp. 4Alg 33]|uniref:FecR family protein n=1 Tax=Formosa sp. 4Alg 33 TaxID=3382189 RepID=UPI003D9C31F1